MSPRYFLHMLLLRKWYILSAAILAPILAGAFLLFAEPVYVSKCKLQIVDRQDERDPTRAARPTLKDDTFIQAQIELIFTDAVMAKVLDKASLLPPPPSQSIIAKYAKLPPTSSEFSPERQRIEVIRELKKSITVEALSPVILILSARMNTPELAQSVSKAAYESYVEEFSRLQKESGELRKIYNDRLSAVQLLIDDTSRQLQEFQSKNATPSVGLIPGTIPDTRPRTDTIAGNDPKLDPVFLQGAREVNPLQKLNQEKVLLELELIKCSAKFAVNSYQCKNIREQIAECEKLIESYKKDLGKQNEMAVMERELNWRLESLHGSYNSILNDRDRIEGTMIVKESLKGTIMVLDQPTFDPLAVFPKKALTLLAAAFGGLVLGLSLAYIAHVLDSTYHLPEDFAADTGLPVLAAIPAH